jgi:hypothetical protein
VRDPASSFSPHSASIRTRDPQASASRSGPFHSASTGYKGYKSL